MALGGKRPGAGRPKLDATKLREALIRVATEHAEEIAMALLNEAKKGNVAAIKEITDRTIGKVTDTSHLNVEIKLVCDL